MRENEGERSIPYTIIAVLILVVILIVVLIYGIISALNDRPSYVVLTYAQDCPAVVVVGEISVYSNGIKVTDVRDLSTPTFIGGEYVFFPATPAQLEIYHSAPDTTTAVRDLLAELQREGRILPVPSVCKP